MYNHKQITDAIRQQIGFQPSYKQVLADSLLTSVSGATYNESHPLLTYKNLSAAVEDWKPSDLPAFSDTRPYREGELVQQDNKAYQALVAIPAGAFTPAQWEETNALSVMLKSVETAAASELVDQLITNKTITTDSKTLFEKLALFEGVGNLSRPLPKSNLFRGIMIDLKNLKDLQVRLHSIGFQLTQANPLLHLYVYHTSQKEYLAKIPLENAGGKLFKWHELSNVILAHVSDDVDAGGSYIIGYRESELVGAVVAKTDYNWKSVPCQTCSGYNKQAYQKWSSYVDIHPFTVQESAIEESEELWDWDAENAYNYNTNNGMNLAVTVECDITDTIVKSAHMLRNAMKINVTVKLLQKLAYNTSNSSDAEKCRQLALYELDNRENHTAGMMKMKEKAMQAIDIDLSGVNSVCFPRKQPRLVKSSW